MGSRKITDERSLLLAAFDAPGDAAGWLVYSDWLEGDQGRPDAAQMVRAHARGVAELAAHLPNAWAGLVREIVRKGEFTWEALCREAGEALACASRAAGSRGVSANHGYPETA